MEAAAGCITWPTPAEPALPQWAGAQPPRLAPQRPHVPRVSWVWLEIGELAAEFAALAAHSERSSCVHGGWRRTWARALRAHVRRSGPRRQGHTCRLVRSGPPLTLPSAAASAASCAIGRLVSQMPFSRPSNYGGGLSGATVDHYKTLLANEDTLALFAGRQPSSPTPMFHSPASWLRPISALTEPHGGARGIATSDTFRRLVARALARRSQPPGRTSSHCKHEPGRTAWPRSFAPPLARPLNSTTRRPRSCLWLLDKLADAAPALVSFVRAFYARQSEYLWRDEAGGCHRIRQGDGCEQARALLQLLRSPGDVGSTLAGR